MITNEQEAIRDVASLLVPLKLESCNVYEIENAAADAVITRSDGCIVGVQITRLKYKDH